MFGIELEKTKRLLANATDAHAREIMSLDPAIRKIRILALEHQKEVLNHPLYSRDYLTEEEREYGSVLMEVLKKVKKHLADEVYEGDLYLECLGAVPADTDFSIVNKRRSQVKEDFPIPEGYHEEYLEE